MCSFSSGGRKVFCNKVILEPRPGESGDGNPVFVMVVSRGMI